MSASATLTPPTVDGDVIHRPALQGWVFIVGGVFFVLTGLAALAVAILVVESGNGGPGVLLFVGGIGLFNIVVGVFVARRGLWYLIDRPRWIIGTDQLQFVDGRARVRLAIPYSNLASVELCKPGMGVVPFIALRLVYPDLLIFYAGGGPPFLPRAHLTRFRCHWLIAAAESKLPLPAVLAKIQSRLENWRSGPPSSQVPNPNANVTTTPDAQQIFTQKQL